MSQEKNLRRIFLRSKAKSQDADSNSTSIFTTPLPVKCLNDLGDVYDEIPASDMLRSPNTTVIMDETHSQVTDENYPAFSSCQDNAELNVEQV